MRNAPIGFDDNSSVSLDEPINSHKQITPLRFAICAGPGAASIDRKGRVAPFLSILAGALHGIGLSKRMNVTMPASTCRSNNSDCDLSGQCRSASVTQTFVPVRGFA
jgi:hypothetical protein